MDWATPQNLILIVGVLLLTSPFVTKTISLWLSSLLWRRNREQSREIGTVIQLLELKNSLERQGCDVAANVTRDLVYAVIYDAKPPEKQEKFKLESNPK
jgi:hypothetical protein